MIKKTVIPFAVGAALYPLLELAWRRYTHWSMSLAGGVCFLGICLIESARSPKPAKCVYCAGMITAVELMFGLVFNADNSIWDYSAMPYNFKGQICLPFTFIWGFLSIPALKLAGVIKTSTQTKRVRPNILRRGWSR